MNEFLNTIVFSNQIKDYLLAIANLITSIFVLTIIRFLIVHKLKSISVKTKLDFDDLIVRLASAFSFPLIFIIGLNLGILFLVVSTKVSRIVNIFSLIIVVFYVVKFFLEIIDYTIDKLARKAKESDTETDSNIFPLIRGTLKLIVWITAIIIVLENLGYDVTALATGLGIGGIAIAFALQNILADIFASVSIYFDRPFEIGDFVNVNGDGGTVTKIGLKSSRLKTLQGNELIIPNKELAQAKIHNYKRMERRGSTFKIGVACNTKIDKLHKIPDIIKNIFSKLKDVELKRVHFESIGEFSHIFEIVYTLNNKNFEFFMDTQQEINFKILEEFEKEGIELAYPTQKILVERENTK